MMTGSSRKNACAWVALAAIVRLAVLFSIPFQAELLLDRPSFMDQWRTAGVSAIDILQRRTELKSLNQDEPAYDDIGKHIAAGDGFVMDTGWMIGTPGQPTMYAGTTYPVFVGALYYLAGGDRQLPVFLAQILLHALSAGLIFAITNRLAGRLAGNVAAAFYTAHPVLI